MREKTIANEKAFFLEPYRYTADFESGSVGSWSAYPPFQDTGYDYTIMVKKIEGNDSKALVREIMPNYAIDYRFGVRKKLDMFVDASSSVSFRFYIKSDSGTKGVVVKFGFDDGRSIETMIPFKKTMKWEKVKIDFDTIIGDNRMKRLQAIAFIVICPDADPGSLHQFAVDDVMVEGYRIMPLKINEPDASWLEEFQCHVLKKHFKEGETIKISTEFPENVKIEKAEAELSRALTAEDRKTFQMKKVSNGRWELEILPGELKKGMWRADIEGVGKDGKRIASTVVLIMKPEKELAGHPRLLISKDDKEKILEKIKRKPYKAIWEAIKSSAESSRKTYNPEDFNYCLDAFDAVYWLPTLPGYNTIIRQPAKLSRANGLVYFLEECNCAGKAVKETLLKMAEWPTWVHPHIFKMGQFTYFIVGMSLEDFSLGYDTIYDLLSPGERKKIADAFFHNGIMGVFKEYVGDNRVSSDTSNWIAHVTGGGILSAVAIQDEYTDAELEPYLTGMILKLGELVKCGFDPTGDYGEGYSYHVYTLQTMAETMAVLERNFGIQFPGKVFHSYRYIFYQAVFPQEDHQGSAAIYDFGDARNQLSSMTPLVYLLNKTRDPLLKWLYDKKPGKEDMDLFYYDDTIPSKGPSDLPTCAWFKDVGTVVFRSGFGYEDFAFIFRCGPFYNHQHFDHGSFYLLDKGEELISEPGRTEYYTDPWYHKLFIQPGGHNCILVDENVESQRAGGDLLHDVKAWQDHGKITNFMEFEAGAFVSGDLTGLYKGKFKHLTRNIVYIKPRTVVIIDKGIGANDARRMNLRFHAKKKEDIKLNGKAVEITKPNASLWIQTVFPEKYEVEVKKRPLTLDEFNEIQGENPFAMLEAGFVQLTTDVIPECTMFINVLTTDREVIGGLNARRTKNYCELTIGGTTYYINCSVGEEMTIGDIRSHALVYTKEWYALA